LTEWWRYFALLVDVESEFLLQADVNEAAGRVVKEVGVVRAPQCIRRIMTEDIVAPKSDGGAVDEIFPARRLC
jgi:hypothetical protein